MRKGFTNLDKPVSYKVAVNKARDLLGDLTGKDMTERAILQSDENGRWSINTNHADVVKALEGKTPKQTKQAAKKDKTPPKPKKDEYKVVVFGPNLSNAGQKKGDMHVHEAGCMDCKHYGPGTKFGGEDNGLELTVKNINAIVTTIFPPSDFDYDATNPGDLGSFASDFYFAPCVPKSLKQEF